MLSEEITTNSALLLSATFSLDNAAHLDLVVSCIQEASLEPFLSEWVVQFK